MRSALTPRTRRRAARSAIAAGAAALGVLALACTAPTAQAAASDGLVISQVYGGGGNSAATFTNDYVELQNTGTSTIDLSAYGVQYQPAGGTSTWQVTPLQGSIAAGAHYLVQEASGGSTGTALPTPDATGSVNMSASSGTVALTTSATALTCHSSADCTGSAAVADLVGYGTASIAEGTAAAGLDSQHADARTAGGADTDDNSADFSAVTPDPQGSGTGGGGGPGPLRIHDIQGDTWVSPDAGDTVTNVPGIVTGIRTSSSKGFWMQDTDPDDDPATSEGIFVYTGSTPTVAVGDSVLVTGKVSDYYPLASGDSVSTTSNLSVTEIGSPTVTVVSSGNDLPAPIVLTPSTVPATYAPDLGGANIEKTPITPSRSALDYYESIEGMRVEVDDARVVGPSNSYGEQYITTKPNQDRTYRGGTELLSDNATPSGRLEIIPNDGSDPAVDVGDVFQGATVGEIDYSLYGGYVLAADTVGTVQHNHLAPVTAKPGTKRQLSVATYNVENLSPTDPSSKFEALAQGVVTNLASPDVVALEEIQDNDGATDDGVVAAGTTLRTLVNAIVAAGGPHYRWQLVNPVDDQDGGQPGGNIRNVFLYNPKRVTFVTRGASGVDRSTTGTRVTSVHGHAALTLSPGRIDPTNPVWTSSRKPLVGQFRFQGTPVFVVANHFDAKLGDQNADGRYQYPAQSSRVQRAGQAQVVHDFVRQILSAQKNAQVVVLGDLNDYQFSPPLRALETGTADGSGASILTDLVTTLPRNQRYTYVYDGISQVLDHILVSPKVRKPVYQVVHVNSEYHDQVSDHDPQVLDFTP